eukprot:295371_1
MVTPLLQINAKDLIDPNDFFGAVNQIYINQPIQQSSQHHTNRQRILSSQLIQHSSSCSSSHHHIQPSLKWIFDYTMDFECWDWMELNLLVIILFLMMTNGVNVFLIGLITLIIFNILLFKCIHYYLNLMSSNVKNVALNRLYYTISLKYVELEEEEMNGFVQQLMEEQFGSSELEKISKPQFVTNQHKFIHSNINNKINDLNNILNNIDLFTNGDIYWYKILYFCIIFLVLMNIYPLIMIYDYSYTATMSNSLYNSLLVLIMTYYILLCIALKHIINSLFHLNHMHNQVQLIYNILYSEYSIEELNSDTNPLDLRINAIAQVLQFFIPNIGTIIVLYTYYLDPKAEESVKMLAWMNRKIRYREGMKNTPIVTSWERTNSRNFEFGSLSNSDGSNTNQSTQSINVFSNFGNSNGNNNNNGNLSWNWDSSDNNNQNDMGFASAESSICPNNYNVPTWFNND